MKVENLRQLVGTAEVDFNKMAEIHGAVNFQKESSFAMMILQDNSYLFGVAQADQDSLKRAIINVAAVGLSLSPALGLAYLTPRSKKVAYVISYRGLIQLAADIGAIMWAKAEIVREKDNFQINGINQPPTHSFQPFTERGAIVGAYCVAKTHDGEHITEIMSIDEIYAIRARSESWKAYEKDNSKKNPWVTDETEMIKKTVIRRAYKSWPLTDTRRSRFERAIEIENELDPMDYSNTPPPANDLKLNAGIQEIRDLLVKVEKSEPEFITYVARAERRDIKALTDLTDSEIQRQLTMLKQMLGKKQIAGQKEATV